MRYIHIVPLVVLIALCTGSSLEAKPTKFVGLSYSLAAPLETNLIGFQYSAGWTWVGMPYGSEGKDRDFAYLVQWGLAHSFGDRLGLLAGISLGIQRNCIDSVEKELNLGRPVCVNEDITSANSLGGAGGLNIGATYQITDSIGALFMYDTFDNKPDGADSLQGIGQWGSTGTGIPIKDPLVSE